MQSSPLERPLISNGIFSWGAGESIVGLLLLLVTISALARENPVPAEFVGEWVPSEIRARRIAGFG